MFHTFHQSNPTPPQTTNQSPQKMPIRLNYFAAKRCSTIRKRDDLSFYVEHVVRKHFWILSCYATFEMPTIKGVKK